MIAARRLFRYFPGTKAVDDVSFEVRAGEVFGFIGPNGAGKTTTIRILATLEVPTYGDAFVDGLSVVNDPDLVRRRLGYMPDGFGTYSSMNCVEYLDFFARANGIVGKDRSAALRRTLSFTGLEKIASKSIRGLSKGMRQRLSLGRAMIHDPAVLILDEPANGLDPRARIELRKMIGELSSNGKALLISSHILTELAEMCDQVGIIERGQLLAVGSVADIQRASQANARVTMEVVERIDEIARWLATHPGVTLVDATRQRVSFSFEGDLQRQSELLAATIAAGFPVCHFATEKQSLEDVFMDITTGAVQ
jgi:ABC-2 type transport system ATP-binding protein